jgi:hypothetical protein
LSQALLAPKQLNLNKLGDAGGLKFGGCSTPSKTNLSMCFDTAASLLGIDQAQKLAHELLASAEELLFSLPKQADLLLYLARKLVHRTA